jgi:3-hydroxybutyrate dehydrogenase
VGPVEWQTQEDFVRVMDVNVFGMVRIIRTFLPLLKRSPGGARIVNTSSILGKLSVPYAAPYCMTKHAVEALSDALR